MTTVEEVPSVEVSDKPSAARGSFALLCSFLVTAILNYAFTILMSWLLPLEQYGMLGVAQAMLLLGATAVNAGFPWALAQAISRLTSIEASAGAFRGALVGNTALGVILGLLVAGASWAGWLALGPAYLPLMLVLGATIVVLAVLAVFAAALQGYLRLESLGVVRTAEVAIKFLSGALLVSLGLGAFGAVAGFFVGSLVSTVLAALMVRRFPLWRGQRWGARSIYTSAGPFFLGMFGLTALVNSDIIGLKYFSPAPVAEQLAGVYQAAVTLARIPIFLTLALFSAVFPYVAYHTARDESADIYARLALKYTLLFIVPLNVVCIAEPDPIIRVFFSSAYDSSAAPLAAASLGTILMTLVHGLAILLQASGRVMLTTIVLPIGAIVEILALAWLVPAHGGTGAGLALVVAGLLLLAILGPVALRSYTLRPSVGAVAGYALALGALIGALYLAPHEGRFETLGGAIAAGLVYLLALIIVGAVTPYDVQILGNGLGPRGAALSTRLQRLVSRLNLLPIAR